MRERPNSAFYRARLRLGMPSSKLESTTLESTGFESMEPTGPDLSEGGIKNRVDSAKAELDRIVKEYLGDDPKLHDLVEQIAKSGDLGLRMVRDGDDDGLATTDAGDGLEAIIQSDGSRPTFLITNGAVDRKSGVVGTWESDLKESDALTNAIACVGRIDDPRPDNTAGFQGTGWLVGERLILTNRHVLQALATRDENGVWKWDTDATIDFGHEFRGRDSIGPRKLERVVYAGPSPVFNPIDHAKVDAALIELAPLATGETAPKPLPVDIAKEWAQPGQKTFVIGYPARPGGISTAVEELFKLLFGFKRLAPGVVMKPNIAMTIGTAHDATTLGGNSGSVVLVIGRERLAAGLHYGGVTGVQNWCHVLGSILDTAEPKSQKTLRDCFKEHGVEMIDSTAQ